MEGLAIFVIGVAAIEILLAGIAYKLSKSNMSEITKVPLVVMSCVFLYASLATAYLSWLCLIFVILGGLILIGALKI